MSCGLCVNCTTRRTWEHVFYTPYLKEEGYSESAKMFISDMKKMDEKALVCQDLKEELREEDWTDYLDIESAQELAQ